MSQLTQARDQLYQQHHNPQVQDLDNYIMILAVDDIDVSFALYLQQKTQIVLDSVCCHYLLASWAFLSRNRAISKCRLNYF